MAKGRKHTKHLKSERAKIKFKAKKSNDQPTKGLNITSTSFKVKKILIREQLKNRDETEILSTRKLNIKDLLARLQHHNPTIRQEALKQLKEILSLHSPKALHSQLSPLLRGIAALSLDRDKSIRRDSLNALNLILGPITNEQLVPFREILISYLNCAMTHIDPRIKEDSLLFFDVLVQHCKHIFAKDSHKILSNFLGMICSLHGERAGQLTAILNFKITSVKWRIKVLKRLANIFTSILNNEELSTAMRLSTLTTTTIRAKRYSRYIPIYNNTDSSIRICEIDFDKDPVSIANCTEEDISTREFVKYINILMPLLFDIWLEVCPDDKSKIYKEIPISDDAATLLNSIIEIIESIIEYIDALNHNEYIKHWFIDTFHNSYMKNFLSRFPYTNAKDIVNESRKRQEDFCQIAFTERCLEQNLGLSRIHIWFTHAFNPDKKFHKLTKDYCLSVTKYLNDTIKNWYIREPSALPQLIKSLRTLFLKASIVWYANRIDLDHTLQLIIDASSRLPTKEFQSHLSLVIGGIMLECKLNKLHRQELFEKFITTLPSLLLRPSINENTIQMIAQIVLRFRNWIQEELIANHKAIIENAKIIDIIGSQDDKQSRLIIYNLFYFMDTQIYY